MASPILSIIIPVYNNETSIERIAKQVLSQPFQDIELIFIDDGSNDDTLGVLRGIKSKDKRVVIQSKRNGGPSSARNLGIDKSRGRYIQFYDSDDSIPNNSITTTISAIGETKADLLVSGWRVDLNTPSGVIDGYKEINPDLENIDKGLVEYTLRSLGNSGVLYNLWNKLFRADIIRDNNIRFREDLKFGEDLLFYLEYVKYIKSISFTPNVTYHYLTNSPTSVFSSSALIPEYRVVNDRAIIQFAGDKPSEPELNLLNWLRWRWLISYWSIVANSKKSFTKKLSLISKFKVPNISLSSLKYIGMKKFLLQFIAYIAHKTHIGALLFGYTVTLIKVIIIRLRSVFNS